MFLGIKRISIITISVLYSQIDLKRANNTAAAKLVLVELRTSGGVLSTIDTPQKIVKLDPDGSQSVDRNIVHSS